MDIDTNNAFSIGARVRWVPVQLPDWAREHLGAATVISHNPHQPCFGPPGSFDPGEAYELRLDGQQGWTVWVPPEELMSLLEERAA